MSGPRSLQPSQWGMMCPADTPEGEACGLVKNLALLAHVTDDEEDEELRRMCYDLAVEDVCLLTGREINAPGTTLVFLNGLMIGVHANPQVLIRQVRMLSNVGCKYICIYFIYLRTDPPVETQGIDW